MTEESNNQMMVYAVELTKGEGGALRTCGVRYVSKDNFLHEAYDIIKYKLVDCRCFEYKGTEYDVWFDEEFLLKDEPIPPLILSDLKPDAFDLICDNFIIAKCGEEGETKPLPKHYIGTFHLFCRCFNASTMVSSSSVTILP